MLDISFYQTLRQYTGWQSISEIKYCLTVTSFWVLVTFWAYRRLTRCGPFDKIALWSLLRTIWDHLGLVSKETIFWRCTNSSDFCNFWKTFSDDDSQKKRSESDSWTCFCYSWLAVRRKHSIILMNHCVIQFFWELSSEIVFSNVAKIMEISASSENRFFGNKTQVISNGH